MGLRKRALQKFGNRRELVVVLRALQQSDAAMQPMIDAVADGLRDVDIYAPDVPYGREFGFLSTHSAASELVSFFSSSFQQREMKPEQSIPTASALTAAPPLRRFSAL